MVQYKSFTIQNTAMEYWKFIFQISCPKATLPNMANNFYAHTNYSRQWSSLHTVIHEHFRATQQGHPSLITCFCDEGYLSHYGHFLLSDEGPHSCNIYMLTTITHIHRILFLTKKLNFQVQDIITIPHHMSMALKIHKKIQFWKYKAVCEIYFAIFELRRI